MNLIKSFLDNLKNIFFEYLRTGVISIILVALSSISIIYATYLSNKDIAYQNQILLDSTGVINKGVISNTNETIVSYDQVNYYYKCQLSGNYSKRCLDALNTLSKEVDSASSSVAAYNSVYNFFLNELEEYVSTNSIFTNANAFLTLAFILTTLLGFTDYYGRILGRK